MNGAGFIKDMINTSRNNRFLLKGDDSAKYKNFDKSYITDWIYSRRVPTYKDATPEMLEEIRLQLSIENQIDWYTQVGIFIATIASLAAFVGTMAF